MLPLRSKLSITLHMGQQVVGAVDVYNAAKLSKGQAWKIDAVELEIMNFTAGAWKDPNSVPTFEQTQTQPFESNSHGLLYSINISRTSA